MRFFVAVAAYLRVDIFVVLAFSMNSCIQRLMYSPTFFRVKTLFLCSFLVKDVATSFRLR